MKKFNQGSALIEVVVAVITVGLLLGAVVSSIFLNNRAQTESRALEASNLFIQQNDLSVKRKTCAGDSDGDGYGSCAITLTDGERINLRCPTSWLSVEIMGATGCKEVFMDNNLNMRFQ